MNQIIETAKDFVFVKIHQLDTCSAEPKNSLSYKLCDVGYFLLSLSFLFVLVIVASIVRACSER